MNTYPARRQRAQELMRQQGIDYLLVSPSSDSVYLMGRRGILSERLNCLVIPANGDPVMVMPAFESLDLQREQGMDVRTWQDGENPYALVASLLAAGGRAIAVCDQMWAQHVVPLQEALPGSRFSLASRILTPLRQVKDAEELAALRRAGAAADAVFADLVASPLRGRTERDVARRISDLLIAHGHQAVTFVIVGSGPNGASPHHTLSDRVLQEGDAVVFDYGGLFDNYSSDITRTVFLGRPPEEFRRVYETVRQAQEAAYQVVRPGVACQEIDRAGRRVIAGAGYGQQFIHRLGHGLGIDDHEEPYIIEGNTTALVPGMVFSDEPGIYLGGRFGVRIEDILAVTEQGAERLNSAPRELIAL
jgi:D-alanyl-D-alanine dipeptidase